MAGGGSPERPGDEVLVTRARRGDVDAFAALVELFGTRLYRFARARLADDGAAADVTQETFLRAWRAIGGFRGECPFAAWLLRIAQRLIINEWQRARRAPSPMTADDVPDPDPAQPADLVEAAAERDDVRRALGSVSPEERELITLMYYDGLSCKEISAVVGAPVGTVKVRLHRARARLRSRLEEMWEVRRA